MKKSITLTDRIYGQFKIADQVIIDLLASPNLQRLKKINQFGIPDEFYHKKNFSRFEHSIGVMLLLRHLGASLEEQVAGLLHDVSHMAFSHVYDWVIEDHTVPGAKKEAAQDEGHVAFISSSAIPKILENRGFDATRITEYHHFSLLEQDSPALCADRVDYSLHEMPEKSALKIFKGLATLNGQIVCRNLKSASLFGREFLKLQREHWGHFEGVIRYAYFAQSLKIALSTGDLIQEDFLVDDEYVIAKLEASSNPKIKLILNLLRASVKKSAAGVIHYKKFRYIDPSFLKNGKPRALSSEDKGFRDLLAAAREENLQGILVPPLDL